LFQFGACHERLFPGLEAAVEVPAQWWIRRRGRRLLAEECTHAIRFAKESPWRTWFGLQKN
jgi:hypothetical protein